MSGRQLAYISRGKLHVYAEGAVNPVESVFGASLRERAVAIHQRHAWKSQGRGAQFMTGMLWPGQARDPAEFPLAITSVARGRVPGELLYSLETDAISGIFLVDSAGVEQRIFHTSDFRVRHMALSCDGTTLAISVVHKNGSANIAVLQLEGTDFYEASEGDSVDLAPRWVPGSRRLVFQSAGIGRDAGGRVSGLGPSTVQELDLDSGEMHPPAESAGHDLLWPQKTADGTLYYISRPRAPETQKVDPLRALRDSLLFPFRALHAVIQYFNFFSMRYTGKPLVSSGGEAGRRQDLKRMMIEGNLLDAAQAGEEGAGDPAASAVPSSWQLIRQAQAGGKEVLASGVLCFDVAADGAVLYSNGSAIHRLGDRDGRSERVVAGSMIEQVAALEG